MRRIIILASIIALITCSYDHVFAAEQQDIKTEALVVQQGGTSDVGEQDTFTCPNCGKSFTVGKHGQEGQTMKCPYCGKEVCTKENAEKGVCFGEDMVFISKYVSRGVTNTDGPVFEPNVWASYKGFTASAWGNMDITNRNRQSGDINEFDLTLDYSNNLGKIFYSGGVIYETYLNTDDDDVVEVYAGLGYDIFFNPKMVVYYDFPHVDGFYACLAVSHSFELPEVVKSIKSSIDLSAQAGYGTRNFNESNFDLEHARAGFTDIVMTAGLPIAISEHFTVKPTVSYSSVLDKRFRRAGASPNNDNIIWGGVVSASF